MKTETTITLPLIHMNGTAAKDLFEGYRAAMDAVQDADDAIKRLEFNARDYYPQGPEAWEKAREEMTERRKKLSEIHADFLAIAIHIQDTANL